MQLHYYTDFANELVLFMFFYLFLYRINFRLRLNHRFVAIYIISIKLVSTFFVFSQKKVFHATVHVRFLLMSSEEKKIETQ